MFLLTSLVGRRLFALLLGVTLLAGGVIGWLGYRAGRDAIENGVYDRLAAVRSARAYELENYFANACTTTSSLGQSRAAAGALAKLGAALRELDDQLARNGFPSEAQARLAEHYRREYLPRLATNSAGPPALADYLPATLAGRFLQERFLVPNPPPSARDGATERSPAGAYGRTLEHYDPMFRNLLRGSKFTDLKLVDAASGRIVYSLALGPDFATSLLTGPYRDTSLAEAVRSVTNAPAGTVQVVDYAFYDPAYGKPIAFLATPVFDGGTRLGALVVQLPGDEIDRIMTAGRRWRDEGLGETGESYLIGPKQLMRSNARLLLERPEEHFAKLAAEGVPGEILQRMRRLKTSILLQEIQSPAAEAVLRGETGTGEVRDSLGNDVLASYTPLAIPGLKWGLVTQIAATEALEPVRRFAETMGIVVAAAFVLFGLLAWFSAQAFLRPIGALTSGAEAVSKGDYSHRIPAVGHDEFAQLGVAFNDMVGSIRLKSAIIEAKNQENEKLLLSILPGVIANRLKAGEQTIADTFPSVTVLFADIVGFTEWSGSIAPVEMVRFLNLLFTQFDRLAREHGVEKIKTIGDAYMAVCGVPQPRADHAQVMVDLARAILVAVAAFNREHGSSFSLRIGINTGPVVAGVIGTSKFIYDLWGDTVNVANRMESSGLPNRIQVTAAVHEQLKDKFRFEPRGEVEVKGKGKMAVYLLQEDATPPPARVLVMPV